MTDVDLADGPAAEPVEPRGPHTALVVCIVMAVLVALLVVVLATRDSSTDRTTQSPLIGEIAPPTEGDTIDGEHFSVADQRGRWVVLNFFASWCVPCLEEHPELQAFDAAHRAEGDAVLVSTTFDDTAEDARAFFADHGGTWPVIDDPENSIGVAYGVAQVPETFVIAPNGTVVQRFAGPVTRAALDELIASYARGEPEADVSTGADDGHEGGEVSP
jgi:cytochrome c biogenesis protein CcmG, thiol:disulfide interchange protein DsbE